MLARRAPGVGNVRTKATGVLALDPGEMVAKMGCGTGTSLPYLTERVGPEGSVVVVDFSPNVLDAARERTREFPQVHLVHGDATRPPVTRDFDASPAAALATFISGIFNDLTAMILSQTDLVGSDR